MKVGLGDSRDSSIYRISINITLVTKMTIVIVLTLDQINHILMFYGVIG